MAIYVCMYIILIRQILTSAFFKYALVLTQGWLNYFSLPSVLSWPFIVQQSQLNERSCSRLLKNSTVTTLLILHSHTYLSVHAYYCWIRRSMYLLACICLHIAVRLCCVCVIHPSHTHTDVIVCLLITSSVYVCVSGAFVLFFSISMFNKCSRTCFKNKFSCLVNFFHFLNPKGIFSEKKFSAYEDFIIEIGAYLFRHFKFLGKEYNNMP